MVAAALAGTAWAAPPAGGNGAAAARSRQPCEQRTAEVFVIDGPVDAALAACVGERLRPTTTELVVSSIGGDVGAALDIAERLARPGLTVRVRRECNSSCANYFLPLASRLVVEPGAVMMLHGGADPALVAGQRARRDAIVAGFVKEGMTREAAERRFDGQLQTMQANVGRQKAFARQQGAGLGWYIWRDADQPTTTHYLDGAPVAAGPGWRMIIVQETLIRSCLPRVAIEPFGADLEKSWLKNPGRAARLRKLGAVASGTLHCVEPG